MNASMRGKKTSKKPVKTTLCPQVGLKGRLKKARGQEIIGLGSSRNGNPFYDIEDLREEAKKRVEPG